MRRNNIYKLGLSLGILPILGLSMFLLVFWAGRNFFGVYIDIEGFQLLYIFISTPLALIGLILFVLSLLNQKLTEENLIKSILGLSLILANYPLLILVLRTEGEVSMRAYLKIQNRSESDIENISIQEPDDQQAFGALKKLDSKIIFYYPDYGSTEDHQYAGISENYLLITVDGQTTKKQLPIIHSGETHSLTLDKNFNLTER